MINLSFSVGAHAQTEDLITDYCECNRVENRAEAKYFDLSEESSLISDSSSLPLDLFSNFDMQNLDPGMLDIIDAQLEIAAGNRSVSKLVKVSVQGFALIFGSVANILVIATILLWFLNASAWVLSAIPDLAQEMPFPLPQEQLAPEVITLNGALLQQRA
ncbi:Oidioi.mRNA.OKI2018_I69.chr2.g4714.t1.cds [Oikopleura dioica]|uniref:Oidioi.mRNA.OKI2018_I69.chr2.g4714.t1.cds n=1 Tax=Oikopleura dioica TaxID=34765 RepID=A0ABN7T3P1_OIKDI|nr:Oidioi.mRNA.OKI2018_I69.chr2.g4714.t1.cds [Oikopleura dioica]